MLNFLRVNMILCDFEMNVVYNVLNVLMLHIFHKRYFVL